MTNSKNGSQVEWRPEDVSDSVLLAVLLRAYHMFHLFQVHKPFFLRWNQLEHDESRESCLRWKRLVVAVVFERRPTTSSRDISPRCGWKAQVVAGRSKNSSFNHRNSPGLLEQWGGLHYLPLTAQPFLRVQTLVTRTQVLRKNPETKK